MDLPRRRSIKSQPITQGSALSTQAAAGSLQTPLRFLKGIGPKRAEQLAAFGLQTVEDLLYHLPFRYEDRRQVKNIDHAIVGQEETFIGTLAVIQKKYNSRRRSQVLLGRLTDHSGAIGLVWYRAPSYLVNALIPGQRLAVHGKVEAGMGGSRQLVHPEFEILEGDDSSREPKILPVYEHPATVPLSLMRKWVSEALIAYGGKLASHLPLSTMQRQKLIDPTDALVEL